MAKWRINSSNILAPTSMKAKEYNMARYVLALREAIRKERDITINDFYKEMAAEERKHFTSSELFFIHITYLNYSE